MAQNLTTASLKFSKFDPNVLKSIMGIAKNKLLTSINSKHPQQSSENDHTRHTTHTPLTSPRKLDKNHRTHKRKLKKNEDSRDYKNFSFLFIFLSS